MDEGEVFPFNFQFPSNIVQVEIFLYVNVSSEFLIFYLANGMKFTDKPNQTEDTKRDNSSIKWGNYIFLR